MTEQRRVRFVGRDIQDLAEDQLRVQVELEWQGESYHGTADEVWRENAEFVCGARATCKALAAVTAAKSTTFTYLKCEPVTAVGSLLVIAAVSVESKGNKQYTVGVCPLVDDPVDAAVRAVLSATNRSMSLLL